ncbi:MAG: GntR family transcriptional regulator [Burkholderiaceae bacterium]
MEHMNVPRRSTLQQETLADKIYRTVRARLQRGEIQATERLLDYEIAEQFGCTRMPVRQALVRLASESHLQRTTRGFVIPRLSDTEVRELFELRRLLEPYAAALATALLSAAQTKALSQAHKDAVAAAAKGDAAKVCDANVRFRCTWLDAVPSQRLKATVQTFSDLAQQVRTHTLPLADTQHVAAELMHAVLLGFQAKNGEIVRAAMLDWVLKAEAAYFRAVLMSAAVVLG